MCSIKHDFPVFASPQRVYDAFTTPDGLDTWWSLTSRGKPDVGEVYNLGFGPGYDWKAVVNIAVRDEAFELEFTDADPEWIGSKVGCRLSGDSERTNFEFYHTGWPEESEHYRISTFCWAMYLRIMKRNIEHGEVVAYADRLNV